MAAAREAYHTAAWPLVLNVCLGPMAAVRKRPRARTEGGHEVQAPAQGGSGALTSCSLPLPPDLLLSVLLWNCCSPTEAFVSAVSFSLGFCRPPGFSLSA